MKSSAFTADTWETAKSSPRAGRTALYIAIVASSSDARDHFYGDSPFVDGSPEYFPIRLSKRLC